MGLPPELGLFTSILTAPITSLLGRNPVLIGGTASATVPFIAAAVRAQGIGGAAKVCLAASVFMMIFCVLRLGRYVAKVPHAVVSGFSCGVGAMMVILQLRTLLGLPAVAGSALGQPARAARPGAVERGADPLGAACSWARSSSPAPSWRRGAGRGRPRRCSASAWPSPPATLLGWHERPLGAVALTLPPFAGFTWEPTDVTEVLPPALGLAFVASVNILITSRVVEHFQGRHRPLRAADADGELGAYGIANLCAGVFGAPMSVGIPARSLANVRCGGTTRLSNFLHAVFLLDPRRLRLGPDRPHPPGGPGRRDRLRRPEPPRVEHLAPAAPDAPARRHRLPGDGPRRLDHQRRRRRRDRLLVLRRPPSSRQARPVATLPDHRATRGGS